MRANRTKQIFELALPQPPTRAIIERQSQVEPAAIQAWKFVPRKGRWTRPNSLPRRRLFAGSQPGQTFLFPHLGLPAPFRFQSAVLSHPAQQPFALLRGAIGALIADVKDSSRQLGAVRAP
jgi:hypothetical protein